MSGNKNAFKVNNSLVNVGGILYPVTHSFVIGEREVWVETDWLDEFDGQIMECYNMVNFAADYLPWGNHLSSVNMRASQTYAAINFESITENYGSFTFVTCDSSGRWIQACNSIGEVGYDGPVQDIWFGIGQPDYVILSGGSGGSSAGTLMPKDKSMNTASFLNPTAHTHWGVNDWSGRMIPVNQRKKDLVMWIYDYEFHMDGQPSQKLNPATELDRYSNSFNWGMNDNLFNPGQRGYRIISNKWKHAPWERYQNLL